MTHPNTPEPLWYADRLRVHAQLAAQRSPA